jgi:ketosteroid isomerase-like protein
MKKSTVVLGLILAGIPAPLPIQAANSAPGPEYQKMSIYFGEWDLVIDNQKTPMGPGGRWVGQAKVRPIMGGYGMEWISKGIGPNGPSEYTELDSYDPVTKKYNWTGYDSSGNSERVSYVIEGDKVTYEGIGVDNGVQFKIRGTTTFAPDRSKATEEREYSTDGKVWKPYNSSRWTKTAPSSDGAKNAAIAQEIIRLEKIWTATGVSRDVDALARLLSDDITSGSSEGKWLNKAQMIADLKTGEYQATFAEADDMKVRVFGDVAIITGRTTEKSRFKGVDSSGQYIWTDTWVLRDGKWLCAATHGSKVGTKIGQ